MSTTAKDTKKVKKTLTSTAVVTNVVICFLLVNHRTGKISEAYLTPFGELSLHLGDAAYFSDHASASMHILAGGKTIAPSGWEKLPGSLFYMPVKVEWKIYSDGTKEDQSTLIRDADEMPGLPKGTTITNAYAGVICREYNNSPLGSTSK